MSVLDYKQVQEVVSPLAVECRFARNTAHTGSGITKLHSYIAFRPPDFEARIRH
jgi:hypothetical protein